MTTLKTLLGVLLASCIIAGVALPRCEAAEKDNSETTIKNLRFSINGNRTRLVFDAEGPKPRAIGPPSADGISVFFSGIVAKLPDKVFQREEVGGKRSEIQARERVL